MYFIRYEQFTKCLHFSLEKKGKRIIHSLYWKFKDNIDLENQQKLSRQYYLQSKIIQNIFCLLEVVGVSFQTKLPTLF